MVSILWKCFIVGLLGGPFYISSVRVDLFHLYGGMPSTDLLENPPNEIASEIYSADGVLLGKCFQENRTPLRYEELPLHMVHALIAVEDCRFKAHAGIDVYGLLRAFFFSILLQRNKGGGSTLTQQLAKNLFNIRKEMSYKGKFANIPFLNTLICKTKEWILAVQLERAYTKEEIIAMYLNTVTFGSNTYGINVAARVFFNKTPAALRVEESALLVGLLRAPTRYSPILHPQEAQKRRNVVLAQMVKYGFLKRSEYNLICEIPIELHYQEENYINGPAAYFMATVRDCLIKWAKVHGYDPRADGLRVYTTVDSGIQAHAEAALQEHMMVLQEKFDKHWQDKNPWIDESGAEITHYIEQAIQKTSLYKQLSKQYDGDSLAIDQALHTPVPQTLFSWNGPIQATISPLAHFKHHRKILQAGCMAMDPHTGYVKAWVGGINYLYFQYDHVKQSKRQAGSTFKPMVYSVALDNGYLPTDLFTDEPVAIPLPNGELWVPKNAWEGYTGNKITLQRALAQSYNSVTTYLVKQLTPQLIVNYAHRMGIKGPLDPVPAIGLGASEVSIYEMVGAYSTFLNKGTWTEPLFITHIEDKDGNLLETFTPQRHEAIHEDTADLITYMLRDKRAFSGVASALKEGNEIAGKTGTTSNHSDGWFIGLTSNLCTGVWVGAQDRCIHFRDFQEGAGSKTARPIWEKFMLKLYRDARINHKKGILLNPDTLSKKVLKIIQSTKNVPAAKAEDSATINLFPKKSRELDVGKIW